MYAKIDSIEKLKEEIHSLKKKNVDTKELTLKHQNYVAGT